MAHLSKIIEEMPYISDKEFARAQERLFSHTSQKSFFREKQFYTFNGVTITKNLSGENCRRLYYINCKFIQSDLTNVGMSGSIIKSTDFIDSILLNTKIDSCELEECNFYYEKPIGFKNVNFSKSMIFNSSFSKCEMEGVNFTDTLLDNVEFVQCLWRSMSLENTVFSNTLLDSVKFEQLNFEFSQFHNIRMNNVRLPFQTIPFIYNGLVYLFNTSDKVWISSRQSSTGRMSIAEYLTNIGDLEVFYTKTQNYFPLANIYIAQSKWDMAYSAIRHGIHFSINIRNYRLVNYYCKLLNLTQEFSTRQLSDIFSFIMKNTNTANWRPRDYYSYKHYVGLIRNNLLNERNSSSLQISIYTNISCLEHNKLSSLISIIDEIVICAEKGSDSNVRHYVEVRHDSPFQLFINYFGMATTLLNIIGTAYLVLWGSSFLYEKIQEHRSKYFKNKLEDLKYQKEKVRKQYYSELVELELELSRQNVREKNIDIELKEIKLAKSIEDMRSLEMLRKGEELRQKLIVQGILIKNSSHTFNDDTHENYDQEIIHIYRESD